MTKARVLAVALIALGAACATLSGGSSDETAIRGVLKEWSAALTAGDVNRLMALYSDSFRSGDRDKAAEAKFMKAEIEEDQFGKNALVVYEHATITVNGDRATVVPIAVSAPTGSNSLGLELRRENGQWRISGMTT